MRLPKQSPAVQRRAVPGSRLRQGGVEPSGIACTLCKMACDHLGGMAQQLCMIACNAGPCS